MALPPMRSGRLEFAMLPVAATVPVSAPLTYMRRFAPSYVTARCVQVLTGNAAVPLADFVDAAQPRAYLAGMRCRSEP